MRDLTPSLFRTLPDSMKLGFDEDFRPDPDSPADELFSTVRGNLLWDDRETFIDWLRDNWTKLDVLRPSIRHHAATE